FDHIDSLPKSNNLKSDKFKYVSTVDFLKNIGTYQDMLAMLSETLYDNAIKNKAIYEEVISHQSKKIGLFS
ncbi:hypothetical protein, partial [Shewanella sairae]